MKITCLADLHGYLPKLGSGDLLVIAGDLTGRDTEVEYQNFRLWLDSRDYKNKVFICGNHDNWIQNHGDPLCASQGSLYLQDSGLEINGLKIWGSPWTSTFEGINPKCKAFTCDTDEELAAKWDLIPTDTDILVTHSPPYGILDKTVKGEHVGSPSLRDSVLNRERFPNLKLHIFGHVHERGGKTWNTNLCMFLNCSHVNARYRPINSQMTVLLRRSNEKLLNLPRIKAEIMTVLS